ncbi:hypothetical protein [Pseudomonas chlororaphis]|uniref:hypothetical protein n=1 Tax=Pseudomonas chlororaphis TaxID=587753 RepID=UPI00406CB5A6
MDIDYLRRLEHASKKHGYGLQWYIMAGYIIEQTLGVDWYQQNCALESQRTAPFDQSLEKDVLVLDYHLNFVRLGHMLFLLKDTPGFEQLLTGLSCREFEPVFFELHAAALLVQNGYPIQFIRPTGVKGEDYDLAVDIDGQRVAVEVKARRAGPIKDSRSLKNALKKAKEQLPRTSPGIICIAISTEYEVAEAARHIEEEIEATLYHFLSGTKRVNGVLVFWHRWVGNPPVCMTMVKEHRNHNARNYLGRNWVVNPAIGMPAANGVQNGFPSFMFDAQQGATVDASNLATELQR